MGRYSKLGVMAILLLPIVLGTLFVPVFAVYGFFIGEYVGAVICTVITVFVYPLMVVALYAEWREWRERRVRLRRT